MSIFSVAIIGVGRVGGALAIALSKKGYEVSQLVTRKYEKAKEIAESIEPRPQVISSEELEKISADVVFITTQDSEIPAVVEVLTERLEHLPYVFHTSGSLSSSVLQPLCNEGCEVASMHPLVSISDAKLGAQHFKNAYFCIEGDPEAVNLAEEIVEALEGTSFSIKTKYKSLYHAAAVTACGHLVALISAAIEMLSECDISKEDSQKFLLPLINSTIQNLSSQTPTQALTGTFARADVDALERHLQALHTIFSPDLLEIYLTLGLRSLPLAESQGADKERLHQIKQILEQANNNKLQNVKKQPKFISKN